MLRKILPALALLLVAGTSSATNITSQTTFIADGTAMGSSVDVEAQFSFNNATNVLTVTLTNLIGNPTSVAQNITDFSFDLISDGSAIHPTCTTDCLTSANAPLGTVTVGSGGTPTYSTTPVDPKWGVSLNNTTGTFLLNGVAGMFTTDSIIGSAGSKGVYSNANTSIAGNTLHNPFVYTSATWTFSLSGAGLPSSFSIGNVVFSFNTTAGDTYSCNVSGCGSGSTVGGGGGIGQVSTPEPLTFVLAGTGLIGIYFIRRRRVNPVTRDRSPKS